MLAGARAVGKYPMIPNRVGVGRGDEWSQTAHEVERFEHQAGGALRMRPGPAQAIEDAVMGRDDLGGVEREAGHPGAEGFGEWRRILSRKAERIVRHGGLDGHREGLLQGGGRCSLGTSDLCTRRPATVHGRSPGTESARSHGRAVHTPHSSGTPAQ